MKSLICVALLLVHCSYAQNNRPNVVFILTDDLGYGDLGILGHPYAITPNLDKLAREGSIFKQFHQTGNVCPNTRAGFMTSRNPSWFPNYTEEYGFRGTKTLTNYLQDAGYTTGHIGKWNIGNDSSTEAIDYGIDDVRITGDIRDDPRGREGLRIDEAIDFISTNGNSTFYLNLWLYATHLPIRPPPEILQNFPQITVDQSLFGNMQAEFDIVEADGASVSEMMRIYLAEVYALDLQVGRLLDHLEAVGLADTTIVIFSSDNGPEQVESNRLEVLGYAGGLRGRKSTFYEGGTRVPFLVRWPGHIPAGRVDETSIMFGLDMLPTICSLAQVPFQVELVEGEDMSDVWLGESRSRTYPLFFRQFRNQNKGYMRYGKWKLLKDEKELYDLESDPYELNNVYALNLDVVAELTKSFESWEAGLPNGHARLPDDPLPFDPTVPVQEIVLPDLEDAFGCFSGKCVESSVTVVPSASPLDLPISFSPTVPGQGTTLPGPAGAIDCVSDNCVRTPSASPSSLSPPSKTFVISSSGDRRTFSSVLILFTGTASLLLY